MATARVLKRSVGLGDVLMLLPVARALKAAADGPVHIACDAKIARSLTGPNWPDLDGFLDPEELARLLAQDPATMVHDLNHPRHSLRRGHQIDSFLAELGFDPGVHDRSIRLPRPEQAQAMVDFYLDEVPEPENCRGRVLLHPASGAMNRTWPRKRWQELADRLAGAGAQVMTIGSRSTADGKGAFALELGDPAQDVADKLGFWETVELMRRSRCLVSTDSAPVQMAGAADIAIVGIYSITKGEWRLPFRDQGLAAAIEPSCPHFPCYPLMYDPVQLERANAHFDAIGVPRQNMLYEWCCDDYSYACLDEQITVDQVFRQVLASLHDPA